MGQAYEALDKAHECYSGLLDEATIGSKDNYLKVPLHLSSEVQVAYSRAAEKRD